MVTIVGGENRAGGFKVIGWGEDLRGTKLWWLLEEVGDSSEELGRRGGGDGLVGGSKILRGVL